MTLWVICRRHRLISFFCVFSSYGIWNVYMKPSYQYYHCITAVVYHTSSPSYRSMGSISFLFKHTLLNDPSRLLVVTGVANYHVSFFFYQDTGCRVMRLQWGGSLDETAKPEAPCLNRRGTIKIPPYPKTICAESISSRDPHRYCSYYDFFFFSHNFLIVSMKWIKTVP